MIIRSLTIRKIEVVTHWTTVWLWNYVFSILMWSHKSWLLIVEFWIISKIKLNYDHSIELYLLNNANKLIPKDAGIVSPIKFHQLWQFTAIFLANLNYYVFLLQAMLKLSNCPHGDADRILLTKLKFIAHVISLPRKNLTAQALCQSFNLKAFNQTYCVLNFL